MPSTVLSSLVNIDALNAAYLMLKRQMDEKVYRTDIYPDEVLGSTDLPYSQSYLSAVNDLNFPWLVSSNGNAIFTSSIINGNLNVHENGIAPGNITATGSITGDRVYNAVWNDIADAITVEDQAVTFEPGYAYAYNGREWFKTKDKNSPYFGIHSDTAGYVLGYNPEINQILIAVGGFVLAYVDKLYESGTFLTYGKDGILTKARRKDEKIAKFFKEEKNLEYHGIQVNGRSWIKIL